MLLLFSVGDFHILLPEHIANECGDFGYIERHGSDAGGTDERFERDSVIKYILNNYIYKTINYSIILYYYVQMYNCYYFYTIHNIVGLIV